VLLYVDYVAFRGQAYHYGPYQDHTSEECLTSHCWHVKEPYHSARVQVMGSGRPTQSQERKQYVCAFWVACQ